MTKENKTLFEKLGGTYSLGADGRYYPNIIVETKEEAIEEPIGKYGLLRKRYITEYRKGFYQTLLWNGSLETYLSEFNAQAQMRFDSIVEELKRTYEITEKMKKEDSISWLKSMAMITAMADEIILNELVYGM